MISSLPEDTPIYLDPLRLSQNCAYETRFFDYIRAFHPALETRYQDYVSTGMDSYYVELREQFEDDSRIQFVFD